MIVTVPDSVSAPDPRLLTGAGQLSFQMAHPDHKRYGPGDNVLVPDAEMFPFRGDPSRSMLVWKKIEIDGGEFKSARVTNGLGKWEIHLMLKSAGAEKFHDLSKANDAIVHGGRALPLAIILDGEIVSAPVFMGPIDSGMAAISGDFTEAEARLFTAMMMNPLPVEVELLFKEDVQPKE